MQGGDKLASYTQLLEKGWFSPREGHYGRTPLHPLQSTSCPCSVPQVLYNESWKQFLLAKYSIWCFIILFFSWHITLLTQGLMAPMADMFASYRVCRTLICLWFFKLSLFLGHLKMGHSNFSNCRICASRTRISLVKCCDSCLRMKVVRYNALFCVLEISKKVLD